MYETELIDFISNIIFLDIQTWFHMAIFKTHAPDVKNCFGKLIMPRFYHETILGI